MRMTRKNGKSPIAVEIYLSIYKTNVTGISCRRFFFFLLYFGYWICEKENKIKANK